MTTTIKPAKPNRAIERRAIASLQPHPQQTAFFVDLPADELKALAADIKANGLLNPIEITPDGTIICGHQRVRAYQLLGRTEIKCWVRNDLAEQGEAAIEARFLSDNANRRQLSKLDLARIYLRQKELADRYSGDGDIRDVIAKHLSISGRTLDRYARVLKTPAEVQRSFSDDQLTLQEAERVAGLPSIVQDQIAKRIREGTEPLAALEAYLPKPSKQTAANPVNTITKQLRVAKAALQGLKKTATIAPDDWHTLLAAAEEVVQLAQNASQKQTKVRNRLAG